MKFLPAAHKKGDDPVFPNRNTFTKAILGAFDVKDNEVRSHIKTKDFFTKASALQLELFGSIATGLPVNAAPENESALSQPEEVLLSLENADNENKNLNQPPSLESNTGGSGGTTTTLGSGSEDNANELQRICRVLADLGFNNIDEVQHAINEKTLIWDTLANYGVKARTAAALEQELAGLKREETAAAIAGAAPSHAAVLNHALDKIEHAEAYAKFLEESKDDLELVIDQLRTKIAGKDKKIHRRNGKISNLRAQVRHLENNRIMASANLSDTDCSSDQSSENGAIQDGDSVSSNSSNNNEDSA